MTRLDHNRAKAQVAAKAGVPITAVRKMTIWGNHSATQYPDVFHAEIDGKNAAEVIGDHAWIENEFIPTVQQRGAAIIEARGASSAASAANAALDHVRDWALGSPADDWVSMAVCSDGSYGVPEGLISGFPVTTKRRRLVDRPRPRPRRVLAGRLDATVAELAKRNATPSPNSASSADAELQVARRRGALSYTSATPIGVAGDDAHTWCGTGRSIGGPDDRWPRAPGRRAGGQVGGESSPRVAAGHGSSRVPCGRARETAAIVGAALGAEVESTSTTGCANGPTGATSPAGLARLPRPVGPQQCRPRLRRSRRAFGPPGGRARADVFVHERAMSGTRTATSSRSRTAGHRRPAGAALRRGRTAGA